MIGTPKIRYSHQTVSSQKGREADYSNERLASASLISSRPLPLSQPMRHEGEKSENEEEVVCLEGHFSDYCRRAGRRRLCPPVATLRQRALIIVSASETEVGTADFHRGYGFLRIIRADPQHPWKSAIGGWLTGLVNLASWSSQRHRF